MAVDFRGHPMFATMGFNAPTRFEADICDCEVWGRIPSDIEGNVNFRARHVKTARLMAECEAHKRLYGVYHNHTFIEAPPK